MRRLIFLFFSKQHEGFSLPTFKANKPWGIIYRVLLWRVWRDCILKRKFVLKRTSFSRSCRRKSKIGVFYTACPSRAITLTYNIDLTWFEIVWQWRPYVIVRVLPSNIFFRFGLILITSWYKKFVWSHFDFWKIIGPDLIPLVDQMFDINTWSSLNQFWSSLWSCFDIILIPKKFSKNLIWLTWTIC